MKATLSKVSFAILAVLTILAVPAVSQAQGEPSAPTMKTSTQTKKPVTRRRTVRRPVILVPVGTNLRVRLEDTLSSKNNRAGDSFEVTVTDPARFDEATVRGHISSIRKSGKVKGRTSMNLAFDSIQLRDGRKGTLHGYVTRVYGDNAGRADEEGGVESGSRGKQTVKRAGIGAAAGAIIGAIAGGGKGAAIGLLIGGAGGAGSVAVQGSKELKLESGTELLIRVTR